MVDHLDEELAEDPTDIHALTEREFVKEICTKHGSEKEEEAAEGIEKMNLIWIKFFALESIFAHPSPFKAQVKDVSSEPLKKKNLFFETPYLHEKTVKRSK
jgi:hypothetical protein